jgi:cobalt-zinc-cadmium efflux system outer membrane protein
MSRKRTSSLYSLYTAISGIVLLPSCSTSWKRIKADCEYESVRHDVAQRTSIEEVGEQAFSAYEIEDWFARGISRVDVARIALINQLYRTPILAELGISKADLVQAGIYKNPYMYNAFAASSPSLISGSNSGADVEMEIDFSISDLWKLPRRKKVAQYDLDLKQLELTNSLIEYVLQVQRMYDTYRALEEKINYAHQSRAMIEHLIEHAERSGKPTLGEQLTSHTLQATRVGWYTTLRTYEQQLYSLRLMLRTTLNITPNIDPIVCASCIEYETIPALDYAHLQEAALAHSYELMRARSAIERAQAAIQFEHVCFFDDFIVGYIFDKNSDGTHNSGLEVDLALPIFDNNRAGIARARFERMKAEQECVRTERKVLAKVGQLYTGLQTIAQIVPLYKETIMHYKKSLEVGGKTPSMEVIYVLAVQSMYQNIFDTQSLLVDAYVQARDNIRQLEALTGMRIGMERSQSECTVQEVSANMSLALPHVTLLAKG